MRTVVEDVLPLMGTADVVRNRQGAIEAISCIFCKTVERESLEMNPVLEGIFWLKFMFGMRFTKGDFFWGGGGGRGKMALFTSPILFFS